jgi:hypothetical protein
VASRIFVVNMQYPGDPSEVAGVYDNIEQAEALEDRLIAESEANSFSELRIYLIGYDLNEEA